MHEVKLKHKHLAMECDQCKLVEDIPLGKTLENTIRVVFLFPQMALSFLSLSPNVIGQVRGTTNVLILRNRMVTHPCFVDDTCCRNVRSLPRLIEGINSGASGK